MVKMVHTCKLCKARSNKTENISYHTFPKDENKKREWLQLLKVDSVSASTRICSLHFNSTDYVNELQGGKPFLKRSAVPSIPDSHNFIIESSIHNEQKTSFETIYIVMKEEESLEIKVKTENECNEIKVKTENECDEINSEDEQNLLTDTNPMITSRRLMGCGSETENNEELPLRNVRRLGDINIDKVSKSPEESKLCLEVALDITSELKAKIKSLQVEKNELKEKVTHLKPVKRRRSKYDKLISDLSGDNSHVENEKNVKNQCQDNMESTRNSPKETSLELSSATLKRPSDEFENDEEPPLKYTRLDNIDIDEILKSTEKSKLYLETAVSTVKDLRTEVKYLQNLRNKLRKKMQTRSGGILK